MCRYAFLGGGMLWVCFGKGKKKKREGKKRSQGGRQVKVVIFFAFKCPIGALLLPTVCTVGALLLPTVCTV